MKASNKLRSRRFPATALCSEPGDLVAFDLRLWHGSWGGKTDRRMCTVVYYKNPETPGEEKAVLQTAEFNACRPQRIFTPSPIFLFSRVGEKCGAQSATSALDRSPLKLDTLQRRVVERPVISGGHSLDVHETTRHCVIRNASSCLQAITRARPETLPAFFMTRLKTTLRDTRCDSEIFFIIKFSAPLQRRLIQNFKRFARRSRTNTIFALGESRAGALSDGFSHARTARRRYCSGHRRLLNAVGVAQWKRGKLSISVSADLLVANCLDRTQGDGGGDASSGVGIGRKMLASASRARASFKCDRPHAAKTETCLSSRASAARRARGLCLPDR